MKKKNYKLDNIDCANCGMKIENKLLKLEGIHSCSLNYMSLSLIVLYDETILTEDKIESTIKKSLFGVEILGKKDLVVSDEDLKIPLEENKVKRLMFGRKNKKL